jgi:hypothetical protein
VTSATALDHGFRTALDLLTGLLVVAALISVVLIRPEPAGVEAEPEAAPDFDLIEEAA